jgi:hypothetical protein
VNGGQGQSLTWVLGVGGRLQSDRQEGLRDPERSRVGSGLRLNLQGGMIAIRQFGLFIPYCLHALICTHKASSLYSERNERGKSLEEDGNREMVECSKLF